MPLEMGFLFFGGKMQAKLKKERSRQYMKDREGMTNVEKLITLQETADRLSLDLWALRRLIWSGVIPVVRLSERRIRIDPRVLDRVILERTETVK